MLLHQGPLKLPLRLTLQEKVNSLETELTTHKKLFKDVVAKLVKKVKSLEVKLKTKKRKVVLSDSDQEEGGEQAVDLDALIALANAAVTVDSNIPPDDPTTDVPTDVPSGVAPTGPSTVSPGSITVPTSSSIPPAEPIPARSGTTTATPSSPVKDARKGKGVAVAEPTPTQDKTFKQLEEERLGWEAAQRLQAQELADLEKQRAESLMKDANLARQMSQDFEMTEDQRKRQQEVLASAANYSDAAWDIILARLQANPDLSSTIFGVDFTDDDFAAKMVALVTSRRKELAEQRAQERRDRPMTPAQLRQYMRTYVKNQGPAVYTTGWTMAQVRKLSPEQLQEEFDKIQRAVAFTRGLKRDGSPMTNASSKKLKIGDIEVDVEAPSHGIPQEVEVEAPSPNVSQEKVDAPSHSQNIPEAQVEVPSQEATVEDVEVPSNIASKAQQTASSLKKVGTKKKLLGRKGVHTSQSTIPIEEGDPDAEHKLCIKYASDEDSASDCDTPVHLYAVVDWELLPTGLGSINAIYRLDNSRKYFTSLREILHLVTRADLMTIYGRVMTFYQDKKAEGVGLVLWGDLKILMDSPEVNDGSDFWKNQHTWSIQNWKLYSFSGVHVLETVSGLVIHMFVDKKYPLTINLIERMLDHQLEICHGTVGNELTTAVQLIAFLKKQISDSKRPKVHEWVINSPCYHNKELASPEQTATAEVVPKSVAGSSFPAASSIQRCCPFLRSSSTRLIDVRFQEYTMCRCSCVQGQDSSKWMLAVKFIFSTSRYVVPTGRVVVPNLQGISEGDYVPLVINVTTGRDEVLSRSRQEDEHKKMLAKNNEAKMMLYKALPKKEYEIPSSFAPEMETKVTTIEESKDFSSLSLDELTGNLKVYEMVIKKDSEIIKGKKDKYKSIALKAKMESSEVETSTSGSEDEEYDMAMIRKERAIESAFDTVTQTISLKNVQNLPEKTKKLLLAGHGVIVVKMTKCQRKTKFVSWLKTLTSSLVTYVCLKAGLEPNEWINDSGSSKRLTGNKNLFSTYQAYGGGSVIFKAT
ncbi:hypothetical protein Tco_0655292 [Tanacetum coccineum]|uniref:Uncharacterized protein n=1 Tax=Tanacetum coccineum TaxID=301880 RepID=A0ABQ4X5K9_9ASTR